MASASIVRQEMPILPAGLPYRVLVRAPWVSELPTPIRHSLFILLRNPDGSEILSYSAPLAALANRSLSLSFMPASEVDRRVVQAAATPDIVQGQPIDMVQQVVANVSAHLVNVRPILELGGEEVVTGAATGMGTSQMLHFAFFAPTVITAGEDVETRAWGRYGISLDLGGISDDVVQNRIDHYESLIEIIEADVPIAEISGNARDLIGLEWFHHVDYYAKTIGRTAGVAFVRYPSLALTYVSGSTTELLGTPVQVAMESVVLDAFRQLQIAVALDGDTDIERSFAFAVGANSSILEGVILTKFMQGGDTKLTGISAGSAMWAAMDQGIPLFLVDFTNLEVGLAAVTTGDAVDSIRDAVNAGLVVLIAQEPPLVDGQHVQAYIALDPETGDGSYIVSGARGGWIYAVCPESAQEFHDCSGWLVALVDSLWIIGLTALGIAAFVVAAILFSYVLVAVLILYEFLPLIAASVLPIIAHPAFVPIAGALANFAVCLGGGGGGGCLRSLITAWPHFFRGR